MTQVFGNIPNGCVSWDQLARVYCGSADVIVQWLLHFSALIEFLDARLHGELCNHIMCD